MEFYRPSQGDKDKIMEQTFMRRKMLERRRQRDSEKEVLECATSQSFSYNIVNYMKTDSVRDQNTGATQVKFMRPIRFTDPSKETIKSSVSLLNPLLVDKYDRLW